MLVVMPIVALAKYDSDFQPDTDYLGAIAEPSWRCPIVADKRMQFVSTGS